MTGCVDKRLYASHSILSDKYVRQVENLLNLWAWRFVISHLKAIWQVGASVILSGIDNTAHNVWSLYKQAERGVVCTLNKFADSQTGRAGLQFLTGTLTGWRYGFVGNSWSSTKGNAQSCARTEYPHATVQAGSWLGADLQKRMREHLNPSCEKWSKPKNMGLY